MPDHCDWGNHESSAFMWELYHGGWLAENIYFLGWANVVKVGGVTIGGVSGIWGSKKDYPRGHYEVAPYRPSDLRSIYYYRRHETEQLSLYPNPIDLFLSHDWPRNITHYGDKAKLFKIRPDFQKSINEDHFGARSLEHLLHHLRPTHWFAGHMHVEFAAAVVHPPGSPPTANPDMLDFAHVPPPPVTMSKRAAQRAAKEAVAAGVTPPTHAASANAASSTGSSTTFLALDKCIDTHNPAVHFTTLPHLAPGPLTYDLEWLAIVRATHPSMPTTHERNLDPTNWDLLRSRVAGAQVDLAERFPLGQADPGLVIPANFAHTAPVHGPHVCGAVYAMAKRPQWNPQTERFATRVLGLTESSVNADGVRAKSITVAPEAPSQQNRTANS
ncbi:lariat debranching enzyme, C-terminal domain-domain-containing protein [Catenaria anguillulae PL171]|uniref:Lariat debranching enzyme, C-terminal domain-domain-containing protein n=1 Tax=Catenaria anguillulae PL171 TaxID=765915 RepID=A0A1Y2HVB1_9FUNG|nr:lariat debranching enzyme, C-terminal domain-domain-containing protein [Catenaria anguillulae PL171]